MRLPGSDNSYCESFLRPRISLYAALDSNGKIYSCISQSNTDKDVIKLYLTNLAKTLDEEDIDWRKTTVIYCDNASY